MKKLAKITLATLATTSIISQTITVQAEETADAVNQARQAVNATQQEVDKAQNEVNQAKKDADEKKKQYDAYVDSESSAKQELETAEQNLKNAKELSTQANDEAKKNQAQTAVDAAQQEYDTAVQTSEQKKQTADTAKAVADQKKNISDEKEKVVETAQNDVNEKLEAKNQASADKDAKNSAFEAAKKVTDAKKDELEKATEEHTQLSDPAAKTNLQNELNDTNAKILDTKQEIVTNKNTISDKQTNVDEKEQKLSELTTKQVELEQKKGEAQQKVKQADSEKAKADADKTTAQNALDSAKEDKQNAETAVSDQQNKVTNIENELHALENGTVPTTELDAARTEMEAKEKEKEIALKKQAEERKKAEEEKSKKEAAKREKLKDDVAAADAEKNAISQKIANVSEQVKKGFEGFLDWAKIKFANDKNTLEDIKNAVNALHEYPAGMIVGDENDATSLRNVKEALKVLVKYNEQRVNDEHFTGLEPLGTTFYMMATAISNADNSANPANGHTRNFNVGENLAWGYTDPNKGWYEDEKLVWEALQEFTAKYLAEHPGVNITKQGPEKTAFDNAWTNYAKNEKKFFNIQTGHYTNAVNRNYIVTGIGRSTVANKRGKMVYDQQLQKFVEVGGEHKYSEDQLDSYGITFSQTFSGNTQGNGPKAEKIYTIAEFTSLFDEYMDTVDTAKLNAKLDEATKKYNDAVTARDAYKGEPALGEREVLPEEKAYDAAVEEYRKAKVAYVQRLPMLNNLKKILRRN